MRVSLNVVQQNNSINASRINQHLDRGKDDSKTGSKEEKLDRVSISSFGKTTSVLESLMKQKQNITDTKNKFIENSLEKGNSMESIKDQLATYEDQIKMVDEQIADTMAEQAKGQVEKGTDKQQAEPKTEEEAQAQKLNNIASLSNDMSQAEVVSSVKNKMEGQARVLNREIKKDGPNASEVSKTNLSEVKGKISDLTETITEKIQATVEECKENGEITTTKSDNVLADTEIGQVEQEALKLDNEEEKATYGDKASIDDNVEV